MLFANKFMEQSNWRCLENKQLKIFFIVYQLLIVKKKADMFIENIDNH